MANEWYVAKCLQCRAVLFEADTDGFTGKIKCQCGTVNLFVDSKQPRCVEHADQLISHSSHTSNQL